MPKKYVIEKTLQIVITEDDLSDDEEELTESLALEISRDIDSYEWEEVSRDVVGVDN